MKRRFRPSPAMAVACLALLVAMAGTGVAASGLPLGSVGTAQLKSGAVTNAKIATNAVTSSKVANGSLKRADFAAGQLPAGPAGPAGAPGPPGPAGPAGPAGIAGLSAVVGPVTGLCASGGGSCQVGASDATCPAGAFVTGGGFGAGSIETFVLFAAATSSSTFHVVAEDEGPFDSSIQAQAFCASGPGAAALATRAHLSSSSLSQSLPALRKEAAVSRARLPFTSG